MRPFTDSPPRRRPRGIVRSLLGLLRPFQGERFTLREAATRDDWRKLVSERTQALALARVEADDLAAELKTKDKALLIADEQRRIAEAAAKHADGERDEALDCGDKGCDECCACLRRAVRTREAETELHVYQEQEAIAETMRARGERDEALKSAAAWEVQAQDTRDKLVEAQRRAQALDEERARAVEMLQGAEERLAGTDQHFLAFRRSLQETLGTPYEGTLHLLKGAADVVEARDAIRKQRDDWQALLQSERAAWREERAGMVRAAASNEYAADERDAAREENARLRELVREAYRLARALRGAREYVAVHAKPETLAKLDALLAAVPAEEPATESRTDALSRADTEAMLNRVPDMSRRPGGES